MSHEETEKGDTLRCPACRSEALYRYGRTRQGKQRRLCLTCGRQFVEETRRPEIAARPTCPLCNSPMYIYRRDVTVTRFRCSRYPLCTQYLTIRKETKG
ncbi:MAG: IS1 family transposase [Geobacteraceae bacterium]|nr:IS1 family transposase [Geobacteraceae bacterium]